MRLVHSLALPLLAAALGCSAHTQSPPPGALPGEPLAPLVDGLAAQLAPTSQRIAPIYESGTTEEDGHIDWNVPLLAGQCYTFAGIGGSGVKHLYLYLWDPRDSRVATEKPERPEVTLRYCPLAAGLFHLQAKTGEGFGPLAVGIYAEPTQNGMPQPPMMAPPPPPPRQCTPHPRPHPCKHNLSTQAPRPTKQSPTGGLGGRPQ